MLYGILIERHLSEKKTILTDKAGDYTYEVLHARALAVLEFFYQQGVKSQDRILRHGRKFCVSDIRQSQGWRCGNRANLGLKPFLTTCPGGRGGMRAACGVNAALAAGIC